MGCVGCVNFDLWRGIGDVVPLGGDLVHGSKAKLICDYNLLFIMNDSL